MPTEPARLVLAACLASALGCQSPPDQPVVLAAPLAPSKLVLGSREGLLADYPCQRCHVYVSPSAPTRPRHDIHPQHFDGATSCYVCHDEQDRNRLRLLTGETVSFDDAHRQCGQCHGEKLRDWNIGAHGKHVGGWAGTKHRLVCTDCHDAHAPARPTVTASAAPPFPRLGIRKGAQR